MVLPKPTKLDGKAPIAMIPSGLAEARTAAFRNPMESSISRQATLSCEDSVLKSMHSPIAKLRCNVDSAGIPQAAGWNLFGCFGAFTTSVNIMMNVTIQFSVTHKFAFSFTPYSLMHRLIIVNGTKDPIPPGHGYWATSRHPALRPCYLG